jgi:NADH:ubiquinone oxidoreductase subunit 2 (subunit N)
MTLKPTRTRQQHQTIRFPVPAKVVVALGVAAILVLGVWPRLVLDFATQEAVQLRQQVMPTFTR